jgi:preprotein translocase subunit SecA
MSDAVLYLPYAQRADAEESRADRMLLAASAGLRRPLQRGRQRARAVAELTEREQSSIDRLSGRAFSTEMLAMRAALVRRGFAPDVIARVFALVRTAADRTLGMRHYPVQVQGAHVMLQGMLAEMDTGEGKTLTATLAAATAALAGQPVHVITVNDYLAQRDGEGMRALYEALGLSVGIAAPGQSPQERRAAYLADVTYCTNKDIGFDYLRDGLALASDRSRGRLLLQKLLGGGEGMDRLLLRGLHFAIVDEADSVLVDEARTPLVISGAGDAKADAALYGAALGIARVLERDSDFTVDLKARRAELTPEGRERVASMQDALPAQWRPARAREELAEQGLAALHLFQLDAHYLVRDGKVMIIDEYTGRVMPDRSWERGLQQLVEAKEGCEVSGRRSTLARITYQRLFRRYLRLGGMTGTAREVAPELEAVYGLKVVRIPPRLPSRRSDHGVRLFSDQAAKWHAVVQTAKELTDRAVLLGTRSVGASEELSRALDAQGVQHTVLNARQDAEEAAIIGRAGESGRVTVATNMAGRGTDIRPPAEVLERGGLHVILTEFHDSRRIDRQLFGRCARQGEPGSCEAIVARDDELFRRQAGFFTRFLFRTPSLLRLATQHAAESANAGERAKTFDSDTRLDRALGFAGQGR